MEIKKNVISIELDHDEKTCLQGTLEIINEIRNNQDILDGCETTCPFAKDCDNTISCHGARCLLDVLYDDLQIILKKCK